MMSTPTVASTKVPGARSGPALPPRLRRVAVAAAPILLTACERPASTLAGAGEQAQLVERLFWVMLPASAVIWVAVVGIGIYAARTGPRPERESTARNFVLWGGMIGPTILVVTLLIAGLLMLRDLRPGQADLDVAVKGEQFWWRVTYDTPQGPVSTANEIRLPVGHTVEFALDSTDVIHSFWLPALGGKLDLIPGRTNRLQLTPTRVGTWIGNCAEFCGTAHAQMRFSAVVLPPEAFDAWLVAESQPARIASEAGRAVFETIGCAACHTIRGTAAAGLAGPDLTHLAGRDTIASGILPMTREALRGWIRDPEALKPGALMPAFPDLPPTQMDALLDYLMGLT